MKAVKLFIAHDVDEAEDLTVFAVEYPLTLDDESLPTDEDDMFQTIEVNNDEELEAWANRQASYGSWQTLSVPVDPNKHEDFIPEDEVSE